MAPVVRCRPVLESCRSTCLCRTRRWRSGPRAENRDLHRPARDSAGSVRAADPSALRTRAGRRRSLRGPHGPRQAGQGSQSARPRVLRAPQGPLNGPFEVEAIHRRGPWRSFEAVEDAPWGGSTGAAASAPRRSATSRRRRPKRAIMLTVSTKPWSPGPSVVARPKRGRPTQATIGLRGIRCGSHRLGTRPGRIRVTARHAPAHQPVPVQSWAASHGAIPAGGPRPRHRPVPGGAAGARAPRASRASRTAAHAGPSSTSRRAAKRTPCAAARRRHSLKPRRRRRPGSGGPVIND